MYAGQPLSLQMILPGWLSPDQFIMSAAGLAAGVAVFAVGSSFIERDGNVKRLRGLKERRAELRGELTKSRRKAIRTGPESTVTFMRKVVTKFQLLKSSSVAGVQKLLNEAGFRS